MMKTEQELADQTRLDQRFGGFGYTITDRGEPRLLDEMLRRIADVGFTHAELDAGFWDVLLGGRLNGHALGRWIAVLDRHRDRIRYTLHGANDLNLFDTSARELNERLLHATVELARAVGAEAMAYHPGVRLKPPIGASVAMLDLMAYEREKLVEVGDAMSAWGGRVGVETWYMVGDVGYSYAIWPDQLAAQVEAVGHPAVGVTLDIGHLYLAARWFGFDFQEGVSRLAPVVNHFHLQDLFGTLSESASDELGHGDLHLPLGWGEIPFDDMFSRNTFPRKPVFHIELSRRTNLRMTDYLDGMMAEARRLASLAPSDLRAARLA